MTDTRSRCAQPPAARAVGSAEKTTQARLKVLVAGHDPSVVRTLEKTIVSQGHEVAKFLDSDRARERCGEEFFPLLLLDRHMVPVDGLEFCRALRTGPRGAEREILIVTADDSAETAHAILAAGADDFLSKSWPPDLLDARLALAGQRAAVKAMGGEIGAQGPIGRAFADGVAQQAVEESLALVEQVKREWESTADSLPQLVCLLDDQGRIIRANRTSEAWGLRAVTEVRGVALHDLFHPECRTPACYMADVWRKARTITAKQKTAEWEVEDTTLGRWFHVEFRPIKKRLDGRTVVARSATVAIFEDITERKLLEMELARAREQEIEIGSKIQQSLLIGEPPRDLPGLTVAAMSIASQKIDGDFYTFFRPNETTLDVIVGDVMGKGVPAALIGAATKNHFLGAMSHLMTRAAGGALPEPREIVAHVHAEMAERLIQLDSFVTLCYARLDLEQNRIVYVDCGHPRTFHFKRSRAECVPIEGINMPLGFTPDESYDQVVVPFERGDAFLFYSDGVIEAGQTWGNLFGQERLSEFFIENSTVPPSELIERIRTAVIDHAGSSDFSDDLTCIAVRVDEARAAATRPTLLEITSDLGELEKVRAFVRSFYNDQEDWDQGEEEEFELELSVNEAVANIIKHAYGGEPGHPISIDAQRSDGRIVFSLFHKGKAFDPDTAPPPLFDGSRDSGYGLYIINQNMDQVTYTQEHKGRCLIRLVKDRRKSRKERD